MTRLEILKKYLAEAMHEPEVNKIYIEDLLESIKWQEQALMQHNKVIEK